MMAIFTLVAYQIVFSRIFNIDTYTEVSENEKLVAERPDKFLFFYAHAGFSNQLYAIQR